MVDIERIDDLQSLSESEELECKLAVGRDGKGKLPSDFWETYSAFANTHGGLVLLGIKEKPIGTFRVEGVVESERVITDLFNTLNNPNKVSFNLLSEKDVSVLPLDGKDVICINVPAATRHQKPVFLNGNPMNGNTYRRLHEGDRPCDDETVRRMLAEQVEDERDSKVMEGYGWEDIDPETFRIYRQMLKDTKPSHPWLELDDFELLKKLKGWRRDRKTRVEGLTIAGLLMFGNWDAIQEGVPHYFVDYQERPEAKRELRWIDRLAPDGTWSGNLFDFYRRVYRKLTDGLKVPFKLADGQRKDETPIHEAIREALVNTLVHADYTGRLPILVVKRPDMFGFRNPGDMRVPLEQALQGGESDCRNRIMHQMFLMIGLGERAGSGVPKIYSGWDWGHWRKPALYEKDEPQQTLLELRMLELLPVSVREQLQQMFGDQLSTLSRLEMLILATAATEQVVTHARICEITTDHNHDVTVSLQQLVRSGYLKPSGHGRGTVYYLKGQSLPTPEQVFGGSPVLDMQALLSQGLSPSLDHEREGEATFQSMGRSYEYYDHSSEHLADSSEHLADSSEHLADSSEYWLENAEGNENNQDECGRLISPDFKAPMIHDLDRLVPQFLAQLESIAAVPREKKRMNKEDMSQVILQLCDGHFITRSCLARLLNRDADALRQQYLKDLLNDHRLEQAFPQVPTHQMQAYMARKCPD